MSEELNATDRAIGQRVRNDNGDGRSSDLHGITQEVEDSLITALQSFTAAYQRSNDLLQQLLELLESFLNRFPPISREEWSFCAMKWVEDKKKWKVRCKRREEKWFVGRSVTARKSCSVRKIYGLKPSRNDSFSGKDQSITNKQIHNIYNVF